MSVSSQRSARSSSSCSSSVFSDAATSVDSPPVASLPPPPYSEQLAPSTSTSPLPAYEQRTRAVSTFGPSSMVPVPSVPSAQYYSAPAPSCSLAAIKPETPSQIVQLICKLLPNSKLAKKMDSAEQDGLKVLEKMDSDEKEKERLKREKREKKIEKLLARDKAMADEFERLGW